MEQPTLPATTANPAPQRPAPHQKEPNQQTIALSRQVADMLSRLRLMEERYANLRREHQLTSQNMIENHQGIAKQQRRLNDSLVELKRTLQDVKEQLDTMQGELTSAANVYDVKTVEGYS
jgi:DNA repair exonuclease SbcCD ATPase subunit